MVRKGKSSTRNPEFNYYESSVGAITKVSSIANYTANKSLNNITLIDSNDYISKQGKEITADAAKNTNCDQYAKKVINIVTGLTDATSYYIFGSPERFVLDNRQQYNNCGVEGILNVLVMAGQKTITNQNSVEKSFTKDLWNRGLVQDDGKLGVFDTDDGGTRITDYRDILEEYGINSKAYTSLSFATTVPDYTNGVSLKDVAYAVKNGGAAILAVSSYLLWHEYEKTNSDIDPEKCILNHAITVTGVVYDKENPTDTDDPVGFYIHDTGVWMTRYISIEEMTEITMADEDNRTWKDTKGAYGTVITDDIKSWLNDINATGNNLANTITGNSGKNIIKGQGGEDMLIGMSGDDKIYGGAGDDEIYGNNKSTTGNKDFTGNNWLYGNGGDDYIYGGYYNDVIYGGSGKDYLYGNEGIDVIYGEAGDDLIYGGDGDDRLLGGAGADVIYGGSGDDTIVGGAGDDIICGGLSYGYVEYGDGYDKIDCGGGNDTVIVKKDCCEDTITSPSGSVNFRFDDDYVKNLVFGFEGKTLLAGYDSDSYIKFTDFYNPKNNSCKKTYITGYNSEKYRVSATSSKGNIKIADANMHNILFSNSTKDNNITTSTHNDIVFMYEGNDTITYTGGKDFYYSTHGNDTYKTSSFNSASHLTICDNFDLENDDNKNPSTGDELGIAAGLDQIYTFFDMTKAGVISNTNDLFLIYNEDYVIENLPSIINDNKDGFIKIDDYFGTGKIETISANGDELVIDNTYLNTIKENVTTWFSTYGSEYSECNTVFEAIEQGGEHLASLIEAYKV